MHKIFNWMRNGNGSVSADSSGATVMHKESSFVYSADFDSFFGARHNAAVSASDVFTPAGRGHHKRARTMHRGSEPAPAKTQILKTRTNIKPPNRLEVSSCSGRSGQLRPPDKSGISSPQPSRSSSFRDTFRGLRRRLTPRRKNGAVDAPPPAIIAAPVEPKRHAVRASPSPIVAIYVNEVERNPEPSASSATVSTVAKIDQPNVISIETIVDENELSELSQLSTSFLATRKSSNEATLRGSTPTLHLSYLPEQYDHDNVAAISSARQPPPSSAPSADNAAPLTGRRMTLAGIRQHHHHRRSSITDGGESPARRRPDTASVDALLHSAGVSQENLAAQKAKDEIRYVREAPVFNANSAPITRATCDIATNPTKNGVATVEDVATTTTATETVARKPSTSGEHLLSTDAARCALVAATAAALPTIAVDEVVGATAPAADVPKITSDPSSTPSTPPPPPPSVKTERRRLRFLVPQISVSSVDSVPRAIARAHVKAMATPSRAMTQSASAATGGGNNYYDDSADDGPLTMYDSAEGLTTTAAATGPSTFDGASSALQRRATAGDAMRRRASLAARRQSNVQLVQKAVGRRASTTLVPLTPAQIHLVRALWRQVYLTKGPTVVGQTLIHRLFFKTPKLKELFRACPLAADGQYSNHDHFAKHHCKAIGEMIEQVVDNLDDLQTVELELENIGRTHARLMNGVLSNLINFCQCSSSWPMPQAYQAGSFEAKNTTSDASTSSGFNAPGSKTKLKSVGELLDCTAW